LIDLKNKLEDIIGSEINNTKLFESINKYNQFKKVLLELNEIEILGSEKLKILHRAIVYGPQFQPDLENFIQYVRENPARLSESSKDVLFTGCSIFINDNMIDLIEEGGGNIVFFDTWIGNHYYSQILDEKIIKSEQDPLDLLVLKFKNNTHGDHSVPNFLEYKITFIEKYFQDYKKKKGKKLGVINHIIKFCDHISLMSSFLKDKLQDKGIAVLNLERDYSRANRGQLSTRIEAYLEMM
jgi:benzoyl-CoA reductase/2-hydroxyglutaryl-CoA dehydratase subunit BcrC/BadD/HgdB